MQDYNYIYGNCVEITLELSCCKYPFSSQLTEFWTENRKSLLVYIAQVHRGVRGLIMDMNGNLVPRATLKIKGRDVTFRSSKRGEYWRLLLPGTYTLGKFSFHFLFTSLFHFTIWCVFQKEYIQTKLLTNCKGSVNFVKHSFISLKEKNFSSIYFLHFFWILCHCHFLLEIPFSLRWVSLLIQTVNIWSLLYLKLHYYIPCLGGFFKKKWWHWWTLVRLFQLYSTQFW